ncbi:MAG TPA: hypothetical protein GX498_09425 [Clostridiales bacterium]|nr:hypothetical protein [Clostridiales bacterium]
MKRFKSIISILIIITMLISSFVYANENTYIVFTDVPENHWAYEAVHNLRVLKITDGIGNNMFGLGMTVTRAEFVAFLVKLMQWELVSPEQGSFADNMDNTAWYYAAIETALQHDVISKDIQNFRPKDAITREEMAVMLVRALGYKSLAEQLNNLDSPFDDVSENIGYITMAKDFGIITGVGNNMFKPKDTAKREEAAAMMTRMYEKLNSPIKELHGFYAIKSAPQADMIKELDSVGFGWSRIEYDAETGSIVLNTTRKNNNEFAIPEGFEAPLSMAVENNVRTSLMVFGSNETIISTKDGSRVPLLQYILTNPEASKQAVEAITSQVNAAFGGDDSLTFQGVVIDFENIRGEELKKAFTEFLAKLKEELDKTDKHLYVAVHPARKPGQAYYDGYDFRSIGEIADKVILMAHDYYAKRLTDAEMEMGYTLTPVSPIDEVYYALKAIKDESTGVKDRSKIWIQFSFDSAQWKLREGKVINRNPYSPGYDAIQRRLLMDEVEISYSERLQNPYASFYDSTDDTLNVIWYEDSRSIQAKIDLAKMFGIHGISLWRLGNIPDFYENENKEIYMDVWRHILRERVF